MTDPPEKPLTWLGSSRRDLKSMPAAVRKEIGTALFWAQKGGKHPSAKPLRGSKFRGVMEVVSDHSGDTYRGVYTTRLAGVVYVLHTFQKKSKAGIATPKADLDLIESRLKDAKTLHAKRSAGPRGSDR